MQILRNFHSPNYDSRDNSPIEYIILHYTEISLEDAISKLCNKESKVSTHYVICANGEIEQLVDDEHRAWHAGESYWQGKEGLNKYSIGIEIDNLGNTPFSDKQMQSCVSLCKHLMQKYDIKRENVLGHSDIAPRRKIDPGIYFDWAYLAKHGIGLWYDMSLIKPSSYECEEVQKSLFKLGYRIEITGMWDKQTSDVMRAFYAHFYNMPLLDLGHDIYSDLDMEYTWDPRANTILRELSQG